jgi:hypothetical protein
MQESNSPTTGSGPGHLVNQTISSRAAGLDGSIQVGHPVADVVNSGAAPGQKAAHGTLGLERSKELYL